METSAREGRNVEEAFIELANLSMQKRESQLAAWRTKKVISYSESFTLPVP